MQLAERELFFLDWRTRVFEEIIDTYSSLISLVKAWIKEAAVLCALKIRFTKAVIFHSRITHWEKTTRKGDHKALVMIHHAKTHKHWVKGEDRLKALAVIWDMWLLLLALLHSPFQTLGKFQPYFLKLLLIWDFLRWWSTISTIFFRQAQYCCYPMPISQGISN